MFLNNFKEEDMTFIKDKVISMIENKKDEEYELLI